MERTEVERILVSTEQALAPGSPVDLKRLGFWRAVETVKDHPDWIEAYGERISAIDREAFRRTAWIGFP